MIFSLSLLMTSTKEFMFYSVFVCNNTQAVIDGFS